MSISFDDLIVKTDTLISAQGSAPSTLMQYRWAWAQFQSFCSDDGNPILTDEVVDRYLGFVVSEHRAGRFKDWKAKLLRKSVLVLWEVATTGSYQWRISRQSHPNDGLNAMLRPVQEQFETWLEHQELAEATQHLHATVSRTILAELPTLGVDTIAALTAADVAAAVVFLGHRYRPGSMRTVLSAMRVFFRFLDESGLRTGLCQTVPATSARRTSPVGVLTRDDVEKLVDAPDPATPAGLRDQAMLLLAARTGLRPIDIVNLRLNDIDWRQGQITLVQHKTGSMLTLPLLADVGDRIAVYLLHGRPVGAIDDHVFLRSQAPFTGLAPSSSLHYVASRALERTGAHTSNGTGRGFRVLRASLATRMLEDITLLPVISGALGHRTIDSAKHYLAGDEKRMRECCLDFAGIEPTGAQP